MIGTTAAEAEAMFWWGLCAILVVAVAGAWLGRKVGK